MSIRNRAIQAKATIQKGAIDRLHMQVSNLLIEEIERLAREALTEHTRLDEFIMCMGSAFFTVKKEKNIEKDNFLGNGLYTVNTETYQYLKPLNDLLDEYDNVYHLTGEPMRFTANGKKITNW